MRFKIIIFLFLCLAPIALLGGGHVEYLGVGITSKDLADATKTIVSGDLEKIRATVGDDSTSWIAAVANINFAGMYNHDTSDEVPIYLVDVYELIDAFTADMPEAISDGIHGDDAITIGATGVYEITYHLDFSSASAAKQYRLNCYEIPAANSGGTITGITQADPGVVTLTSASGLTIGDDVKFVGIIGMTELNENIYEVGVVIDTDPYTFQILTQEGANVNTGTGHTAWSSAGEVFKCTELEGLSCTIDYGVQDDVATAAATGFASLTSGNTLEVYIRGLTDATNPTMKSGQFSIQRIQ